MNKKFEIICTKCGKRQPKNIVECLYCHGSLETAYKLRNDRNSLFATFNFLPVSESDLTIKLAELETPIFKLAGHGYSKIEYLSRCGSSKTREALIEVSIAKKLGYSGIVVASTGNMAIAVSDISKLLDLSCVLILPKKTNSAKISLLKHGGSKLLFCKGNYDDCVIKARKIAQEKNYFLASLQAFRFDGYKTIAYELYYQFNGRIPQNIIIPLGDGTTYVGVYKGFKDLKDCKMIKNIPHMIGVQEKRCDPIKRKFDVDKRFSLIKNNVLCGAINIHKPIDIDKVIEVVKLTGGKIYSYPPSDIKRAYKKLLFFNIKAEYASALTYCPIENLDIKNYVLLITGSSDRN